LVYTAVPRSSNSTYSATTDSLLPPVRVTVSVCRTLEPSPSMMVPSDTTKLSVPASPSSRILANTTDVGVISTGALDMPPLGCCKYRTSVNALGAALNADVSAVASERSTSTFSWYASEEVATFTVKLSNWATPAAADTRVTPDSTADAGPSASTACTSNDACSPFVTCCPASFRKRTLTEMGCPTTTS